MSTPPPDGSPSPNATTTSYSALLGTLVQRYRRVLTNPNFGVFNAERGNASEPLIWFQILLLALFVALTLVFSQGHVSLLTPVFYSISAVFTIGGFFLSEYISYRTARALQGNGTFLQQCYLALLIYVPITVLHFFVARLPLFGNNVAWLLDLYSLVLYVIMIRAVHNLSTKRALLATATPFIIAMACIGTLLYIGVML